ncbi:hypothetical protein JL193_10480 [Polaribacter batillariae]|uniref:Uncharacterized protein n=1 Tax=Polaribacter batillariae TaxID=2808900 RepID=A0ABX7SUC0_9FLAO|nr:hypothetical protein [Polaribacter batillariae]QTD36571.1 hypothetical protein JL193_10480 [Polaribacter batillariae]
MKITKKRVVLFLLFIFPLICFLILSTGKNNFTKLPVLTKNVIDISAIKPSKTFKDHISVVCFLGDNIEVNKAGFFNLNEKIYKSFIDYKQFQIIAVYPKEKEVQVAVLKKEIGAFTDMAKWNFIAADKEEIKILFSSFKTNENLANLYTSKAFLIDKNGNLRGRTNDKDSTIYGKLFGYNMQSVAELNAKLKDDIKVLYYEYYAAFKNKNENKADRKEVGL